MWSSDDPVERILDSLKQFNVRLQRAYKNCIKIVQLLTDTFACTLDILCVNNLLILYTDVVHPCKGKATRPVNVVTCSIYFVGCSKCVS